MFKKYGMDVDDAVIIKEFKDNGYWGQECLINLTGCDLETIKSGDKIKEYIEKLCDIIDMEMYGPTMLERFGSGHLYGYSVMQLIRTSSITCHFAEEDGRVFIDIFSCKHFGPKVASNFTSDFFNAESCEFETIFRD